MTEIDLIKNELLPIISQTQPTVLNDLFLGKYILKPNATGCFEYNKEWFVYQNDEYMQSSAITGPFSAEKCIFALAIILNVYKHLLQYEFNDEEREVFCHNHFKSLDEIDEYYRSRITKYHYYKSDYGNGIMRRNGARVEMLTIGGDWFEKQELFSKLIGGDIDFDEISEGQALIIAEERKVNSR